SGRVFDGEMVTAITVTALPALASSAYWSLRAFALLRQGLGHSYAAPRERPQWRRLSQFRVAIVALLMAAVRVQAEYGGQAASRALTNICNELGWFPVRHAVVLQAGRA